VCISTSNGLGVILTSDSGHIHCHRHGLELSLNKEEILRQFSNYRSVLCTLHMGERGGTVVKVLCYKSEGRWLDPSWCHWNFSLT